MSKTKIEYQIWSEYAGMKEEVDSADNLKDAQTLLTNYKIAFHYAIKVWIKKVRIKETVSVNITYEGDDIIKHNLYDT